MTYQRELREEDVIIALTRAKWSYGTAKGLGEAGARGAAGGSRGRLGDRGVGLVVECRLRIMRAYWWIENFACRSRTGIFKGTVFLGTVTIAGVLHGFCLTRTFSLHFCFRK
jgi:hypothetical protein